MVAQVCFMGVINPLNPEVETAEQVRDELLTAAKHIPVDRLGATDDCGFSPFSRDVKPKHGSPDFARDIAMEKIAARLAGGARAPGVGGRRGRLTRGSRSGAPPVRVARAARGSAPPGGDREEPGEDAERRPRAAARSAPPRAARSRARPSRRAGS